MESIGMNMMPPLSPDYCRKFKKNMIKPNFSLKLWKEKCISYPVSSTATSSVELKFFNTNNSMI